MKKSRTLRLCGAVEIDRRAPGRVMPVGEELRRIGVQIISFGAEVVVDHVEHHAEAARMRGGDQRLQIVGRAVGGVGREGQHAVVAPAALAREIRKRHELDHRDAELHEMIEPRSTPAKVPSGVKVPTCSS